MAWRLMHIGHSKEKYAGTVEKTTGGQLNWTGKVNIIEKEFVKPFKWKKPSMVFVNSESDLFHESIPFQVVRAIFGVMSVCKEHTFQILTKRPKRMVEFFEWLELMDPDWQDDPANYAYDLCVEHSIETGCGSAFETTEWPLKNVWLGVSVEDQKVADERIPLLLQAPAAVRFLSCEPLLGPLDLTAIPQTVSPGYFGDCLQPYHVPRCDKNTPYPKIDWCIVGGESGKDARPVHIEWVRSLRNQCNSAGVAFFFKQFGEWVPEGQELAFIAGSKVRDVRNILLDGSVYKEGFINAGELACMKKVGKKLAGRQLDGREWNEFPVPGKRSVVADDPDLYVGGFD